jgi:transcriptional regulator with XRE-family HTH domain
MKTSLAEFVSQTREKLGLSQSGLAKKSNLPIEVIEAIESAQELFLPTTIRQKLAKGLKLNTRDVKLYEKHIDDNVAPQELIEVLKISILDGEKDLKCPECSSDLICHVEKMYDLEDNLIKHPKARCSKCPFQIK